MDEISNNDNNVNFSICTIKDNLNVKGEMTLLSELIRVFKCDDKGYINPIQTADDIYFQKLHSMSCEFKASYPEFFRLIEILESLKHDEKFFVVPGNVNDDTTINNYISIQRRLYQSNDIQYPIDEKLVMKNYNFYIWGDKRAYVGEGDRQKRVCRFCNQQSPTVTFRNRAHAISESLGNKLLFCNEECDICNHEKFCEIEQDFFNFHRPYYSLYQKKGKEGIPSIQGKNIKIDNKNKNGGIVIKSKSDFSSLENLFNKDHIIDEPSLKYTPQNLYKCLCKFAVSVIEKKYLNKLSKTIQWITSDSTVERLPIVLIRQSKIHDQPLIGIYVKKDSTDSDLPEFIIRLFIINFEYLYILPFVDDNEVILSESARSELEDIFDLSTYTEVDFSSNIKESIHIQFGINVQDGAEIVTINKSEFNSLTEEEREKKYPKAAGFLINPNA